MLAALYLVATLLYGCADASWNLTCTTCGVSIVVSDPGVGGLVWQAVDAAGAPFTSIAGLPGSDVQLAGAAYECAVDHVDVSIQACGVQPDSPPCGLTVTCPGVDGAIELTSTFTLYPDSPGVVRQSAAVFSIAGADFIVTGVSIVNIALPLSVGSGPTLFHMGQRGHMPQSHAVVPNAPAIRLQMGCYPSSQEDISQTAWLALSWSSSANGAASAAAIGIEFDGKSTTTVGSVAGACDSVRIHVVCAVAVWRVCARGAQHTHTHTQTHTQTHRHTHTHTHTDTHTHTHTQAHTSTHKGSLTTVFTTTATRYTAPQTNAHMHTVGWDSPHP
jgi:hypothetical protein